MSSGKIDAAGHEATRVLQQPAVQAYCCTTQPSCESENSKSALDRRLDQALDQTFPASDPVSVVCTACPPEHFNAGQER